MPIDESSEADNPIETSVQTGDASAPRPAPRVFVSYTHDNDAHVEAVLRLCRLLRGAGGVDVRVDRWGLDERRDWYLWAGTQLTEVDYVLVVASPLCKRVGEGHSDGQVNRGMQSEMSMLRELLHSDRDTWRRKILPVVLPGRNPDEIPLFLQPQTCDHYIVEDLTLIGTEDLLRVITRQPPHLPPSINPNVVLLPPRSAGGSVTDWQIAPKSDTNIGPSKPAGRNARSHAVLVSIIIAVAIVTILVGWALVSLYDGIQTQGKNGTDGSHVSSATVPATPNTASRATSRPPDQRPAGTPLYNCSVAISQHYGVYFGPECPTPTKNDGDLRVEWGWYHPIYTTYGSNTLALLEPHISITYDSCNSDTNYHSSIGGYLGGPGAGATICFRGHGIVAAATVTERSDTDPSGDSSSATFNVTVWQGPPG